MSKYIGLLFILITVIGCHESQTEIPAAVPSKARGKLFIIGGGDRTPELMANMIEEAHLKPGDYIAVLPMAGEEPDSSFWYFKKDIPTHVGIQCANLNFSDTTRNISAMKDSLRMAKLVFICGGDQTRFMKVVQRQNIHHLIEEAYNNGSVIAGTSAGAAVMSNIMITGDQKKDTAYSATYAMIEGNNAIYTKGLGFIKDGIVDQHFVTRSRYNRLITALMDYPEMKFGMGVEEETAVLVQGKKCTVVGKGPIVFFTNKKKIKTKGDLVEDAQFDLRIMGSGKTFDLP